MPPVLPTMLSPVLFVRVLLNKVFLFGNFRTADAFKKVIFLTFLVVLGGQIL